MSSPRNGHIHRRPRHDSGVVRLWPWARSRRAPWTAIDAADAADLSPRRTRAIVRALHDAGYLDCVRPSEHDGTAQGAAQWAMATAGRRLPGPPVMVTDGAGNYVGVRAPQPKRAARQAIPAVLPSI